MDGLTNPAPLSTSTLILNLLLGSILICSSGLVLCPIWRGVVQLTHIRPVLPSLSLVTTLVISVVKASLAISELLTDDDLRE